MSGIHINGRPMLTQAMADNQKIRDQFACAAIQGLLAGDPAWISNPANLVLEAFMIADLAIKERAK